MSQEMRFKMAADWWGRMRGLLGRKPSWLGADGVLVLVPCNSVHTYGMRRSIDIAFADERGRVLKSLEAVKPGRVIACPRACCALERFTPQSIAAPIVSGVPDGSTGWPVPGEQLKMRL